jgi:ATP-dependent Zn protease
MEHHAGLERLAQALLANETLSGEEIRAVLAEQAAV